MMNVFLPFLRIQVTAQDSQGEEGAGAIWRVVVLQESIHVEAKVYGSG